MPARPLHALLLLTLVATGPLAAEPLLWDANGFIPGLGGAGVWQDSGNTWSTDPAGTLSTEWINAKADTADFRETPGVVTIHEAGVRAALLAFNAGGYTLAGPGLITLATEAKPETILIHRQAGDAPVTIDAPVVIADHPKTGGNAVFTIKNSAAGPLILGADLSIESSAKSLRSYRFETTSPEAVIHLTGRILGATGGARTRLFFTGPGVTRLDCVTNTTTDSYIDEGVLLLDNGRALGSRGLNMGASNTPGVMAVYTNGPVVIPNRIELKGRGNARHTLGGATADTSTFSGQIKFTASGAPIRLSAAAGGRVNLTGTLMNKHPLDKVGPGIVASRAPPTPNPARSPFRKARS